MKTEPRYLTLIGMSNAGKSYWANRLHRELGFQIFSCDDEIGARLEGLLPDDDYSFVVRLAHWMGHPSEPAFEAKQKKYAEVELLVMKDVVGKLRAGGIAEPTVIDTTGSVIYLPADLQRQLKSLTTVVYLKTSERMIYDMIERFTKYPKPILWNGMLHRNADETWEQAMRRCYPELLKARAVAYESLADITIDMHQSRKELTNAQRFLYCFRRVV